MPRGHLRGVGVIYVGRNNFLDSERAATAPCISVKMSVNGIFFLVLISPLLVSAVTFQARKSSGFLVPARLSKGRSIGSQFMRRCWTLIES